MTSLEFSVSGGQLGRALANDAEECAYGLVAMTEETTAADLGQYVGEFLYETDKATVITFLRALADAIEAVK